MAGNGQASLQINPYPNGSDESQRSEILEGTLLLKTATGAIIQITGWSITTNVLTFTAVNVLTGGGGDVITVSNFVGAFTFLNGTYTTSSATATTIVVPLTHANGSGTQTGVAVIQPTYQTLGIPFVYTFTNVAGGQVIPILGSGAVPRWIQLQTLAGSAFNYKINTVVSPNLLLIFTGITQVADAAAITADTIGFRAEFTRGVGGSGY
jgi:hypothetical protein